MFLDTHPHALLILNCKQLGLYRAGQGELQSSHAQSGVGVRAGDPWAHADWQAAPGNATDRRGEIANNLRQTKT